MVHKVGYVWKVKVALGRWTTTLCSSILFKAKYGMKKAQLGSKKILFMDCGLCKFGQTLISVRQALIILNLIHFVQRCCKGV